MPYPDYPANGQHTIESCTVSSLFKTVARRMPVLIPVAVAVLLGFFTNADAVITATKTYTFLTGDGDGKADFTVNGDGSNTSTGDNYPGGVIQNTSGADGASAGNGVYLSNARNVTLRRMRIANNQNFAIPARRSADLRWSTALLTARMAVTRTLLMKGAWPSVN